MVDLTKYSNKAIQQLLKVNPTVAKMLPTESNESIKLFLSRNYKLSQTQIDYFIKNI